MRSRSATRAPLTVAQWWWLLGIVLVGAALRVAWFSFAHTEAPTTPIFTGDQFPYFFYGRQIAEGGGYVHYVTGQATAYYPIGFPAILGGLYWVALHTPVTDDLMLVTGVYHVVISVATIALAFVVARRLLGATAALVAAAIVALFPALIYQVTTIQLETTFTFLCMAALALIVDHDWAAGPPSRARLLAFGAILGASAMVRPFSLWLWVGLVAALLATGLGWRKALLAALWPAIVLVVIFTPWTVRNQARMDSPLFSSSNMGDTLCMDRGEGATGGFRWADHDPCADPDLPEAERNSESTRKAIAWVARNPGREAVQIVRRGRRIFGSSSDGVLATEAVSTEPVFTPRQVTRFEDLADAYWFAVLALAVAGLPLLWRRAPRPERRLFASLLAALVVIPLLLWGAPRFNLPFLPLLAVPAAGAVTWLAGRVRGESATPAREPEPESEGATPGSDLPVGVT